ncbi:MULTISPECIES: hypothetical protein [Mycobacterium]|uniref:Uncharacterized protein n=1 Tax=Mycobacterium paragordonae TaxID=1389713 RepID=A0AAJ1W6H2_9MYCO|nr:MULTISPECIES: hypothetical protein [Mycobacterium]MBI2699706.1 hypothetical protein [Mycobacterium sp.]MDP7739248.1 hypothetical protein [Mycobacterium paragordonae]PJE02596.1 MAG: hypothetical protein CK429_34305 [Mycobacterium sp.]PJE10689.1 MAG: hypothetical protein CK428_16070 [Mycobacterium sp.]PJE25339.1 MAG: hypothetical protein CK431_01265 [Mycobacterium sp.]
MSAIDALVAASQEQHRRYYELFGANPVRGDGLRELAAFSHDVGQQARDIREQVLALHFSTAITG